MSQETFQGPLLPPTLPLHSPGCELGIYDTLTPKDHGGKMSFDNVSVRVCQCRQMGERMCLSLGDWGPALGAPLFTSGLQSLTHFLPMNLRVM